MGLSVIFCLIFMEVRALVKYDCVWPALNSQFSACPANCYSFRDPPLTAIYSEVPERILGNFRHTGCSRAESKVWLSVKPTSAGCNRRVCATLSTDQEMIAARNTIDAHAQDFAMNDQLLCGGADRSLARPTSRYHMTESIVSLDGQPSDFFFFF